MNEGVMQEKFYNLNKSYYDRNAARYESASWYFFNRYKNNSVVKELKQCLGALEDGSAIRVLEIGPGTGYLLSRLIPLAKQKLRYTGIEHSDAMCRVLESNFARLCSEFSVSHASVSAELLEKRFNGQAYDLILGSSILHHLPDYAKVINVLSTLLADGGVFYFVREPIHKDECLKYATLAAILERAFSAVNDFLMSPSVRSRLWPGKVKAEDATRIALHMFLEGVSTAVFRELIGMKWEVLFYRKYNRRVSSLLSYLENKWLGWFRMDIFGNTLFSIGLRKGPGGECAHS